MQITIRIKDEDDARVRKVAAGFQMTRYELDRRLYLSGLAHAEQGGDLYRPGAPDRLEKLLEDVLSALQIGRARDFNLAADNLEMRVCLRTLCEHVAPESGTRVDERVKKNIRQFLATFEHIHNAAPPPQA